MPKNSVRPFLLPVGVAIGLVIVYTKAAINANEVLKTGHSGLRPKDSGRWVS